MPLYAVERELGHVTPEQLQLGLQEILRLCQQFGLQGKNVRYISTVVLPAEGRGLCVFGAQNSEWIKEVQDAAGMPYSRIVPLLDLTPNQVNRDVSRRRRPLHNASAQSDADTHDDPMRSDPAHEMARWFEEGQRLFGTWAERVERLEQRQLTLERDKEQLHRTMIQLEHDNEILRAQREELLAAFDALAGNVTQVVDEVLRRFRRENHPGGSASGEPNRGE
jgi:hypothetical protein